MANSILTSLAAQVTATVGVMQSAELFINGTAARIQAAIDKALANGATEAELAPVQAEVDALKSESDTLATAITANSPAA